MSERSAEQITQLLRRWSAGDADAADRVLPLVYDELHQIARAYFSRERPSHTLQPTAVVNEVYLRLEAQGPMSWDDRSHFLGIAARLMRQILVDHARARSREKRGRAFDLVRLLDVPEPIVESPEGLLAVDEALSRLGRQDAQKAAVVELRFFGGLENDEIAAMLGVSKTTVVRQWRRARAWLFAELQ